MKLLKNIVGAGFCLIVCLQVTGSDRIDDMIEKLKTRNWDTYAEKLVKKGGKAVEPLITALSSHSERLVRERAAETLSYYTGTKHEKRILDLLISTASDPDEQSRVRQAAAWGLRNFKNDTANSFLISLMESSGTPGNIRTFACRALGTIGFISSENILIKYLNDTDSYWAAVSLGEIRSSKAVPALIQHTQSNNWYVVKACQNSLIQIGEKAVPAVAEQLNNDDPYLQWQAAHILTRIGTEQTWPFLSECLTSPDWKIRNEAAVFFVKEKIIKALPIITILQSHENPDIQRDIQWVVDSLKKLK